MSARSLLGLVLLGLIGALGLGRPPTAAGFDDPLGGYEAESDADGFALPRTEELTLTVRLKATGTGYLLPEGLTSVEGEEFRLDGTLRLQMFGNPASWFGYQVHGRLREECLSSPNLGGVEGITNATTELFRAFDGTAVDDHGSRARLVSELAYANIRFSVGPATLRVGRQPITYGRSFFWSPMDWLTPFSPTEIDREFKGVVDAATLSWRLGQFSGLELAYATGRSREHDAFSWQESATLGRVYMTALDWDFEVLGGTVREELRLGGAIAGEVLGAGLRGEWTWHDPDSEDADPFLSATLGSDYRWPNSLYVIGEVHRNGFGATSPDGYLPVAISERFRTGQVQNLGRWYVAVQATFEATPLITPGIASYVSLIDGSGLIGPSVQVSVTDESELLAGCFIPWGRGPAGADVGSEYGNYPTVAYLEFRYVF